MFTCNSVDCLLILQEIRGRGWARNIVQIQYLNSFEQKIIKLGCCLSLIKPEMTDLGIEILYVRKSILVIGICQKSLTSEVEHVGKV